MALLELPRNLIPADGRPGWGEWLACTLPAAVRAAEQQWSLTLGRPFQPEGQTSWVAPASGPAGSGLVLKIIWPHPEAAQEARGLRTWAGSGAVGLAASCELDGATALLVERCVPGTPLRRRPENEQDLVVSGLLHRLWAEPGPDHPFQTLEQMCRYWADRFERQAATGDVRLDPGLARAGIALLRELPATADRRVLLFTDLHAGNVLRAAREPWLAIDPKPHVGDPCYDPLQHMLNCPHRLRADPAGLARRMAGLLGLDGERMLLWLFARCVQQSPSWPWLGAVARLAPG